MISGFNSFCEFLFQGLLLVIVIMIDGSEKRNSDKLALKLHSSLVMNGFKVRALMGPSLRRRIKSFKLFDA